MEELFIPVLVGTTRERRKSIHAARFVESVGKTLPSVTTQLIDPKDFQFPGDGNDPEGKDPRYGAITAKADGFFIVVPEYNHSFPGSLKRMLDSELQNYIHKPVAFAGVSNGQWGGVRAIESLVGAVREMGLVATFTDMHFPRVQDLFDNSGMIQDPVYEKYATDAWQELIWMARIFKWGREHIPSKYHQTR